MKSTSDTTARTYEEWRAEIRATLNNIPKLGEMARETWGITTLLLHITLILLDIRELLKDKHNA